MKHYKRLYPSDPYNVRIGRIGFYLRSKQTREDFPQCWDIIKSEYGLHVHLGHFVFSVFTCNMDYTKHFIEVTA